MGMEAFRQARRSDHDYAADAGCEEAEHAILSGWNTMGTGSGSTTWVSRFWYDVVTGRPGSSGWIVKVSWLARPAIEIPLGNGSGSGDTMTRFQSHSRSRSLRPCG